MVRKANLFDDGSMLMILALLALLVWATWRTVVLVRTDGLGDVPAPRSHDHEWVAPWRA